MSEASGKINEYLDRLSELLGGETYHGFRSEVWGLFAEAVDEGRRDRDITHERKMTEVMGKLSVAYYNSPLVKQLLSLWRTRHER